VELVEVMKESDKDEMEDVKRLEVGDGGGLKGGSKWNLRGRKRRGTGLIAMRLNTGTFKIFICETIRWRLMAYNLP